MEWGQQQERARSGGGPGSRGQGTRKKEGLTCGPWLSVGAGLSRGGELDSARERASWAAGERVGRAGLLGRALAWAGGGLGLTGSCRVGLVPVLGWVLGLVGFGVLVSFLFLTQLKSKELKLI